MTDLQSVATSKSPAIQLLYTGTRTSLNKGTTADRLVPHEPSMYTTADDEPTVQMSDKDFNTESTKAVQNVQQEKDKRQAAVVKFPVKRTEVTDNNERLRNSQTDDRHSKRVRFKTKRFIQQY